MKNPLIELSENYEEWGEDFIRKNKKDAPDREDAFGNACLKIIEYLKGYRIRNDGKRFMVKNLKGLIIHAAKNELKLIKKNLNRFGPLDENLVKNMEKSIIIFPEEEDTIKNLQLISLKKGFAKLGKKCKEILTLFYYRRLSIKEIKVKMNYNSEGVVKERLRKCRESLRKSTKN